MTNKEAIEFIDDRMCWGRGKWSEHHMPEIDEYWQAGLMAIEALKAQDAKDAKSMPSQLPSGGAIYRQAAIDALDVLCQEHRYKIPGKSETYSQYNEAWQDALDRAEGAIFNLPSAQPDTDHIYAELSKAYNVPGLPKEAIGIIGDLMVSLDEPSAQPGITLESAIEYLHNIGWMQEHDRILTKDRDIPKKPGKTTDRAWGIPHRQAVCPNCDCYLGTVHFICESDKRKVTYCESCGQAIDWEGWEEDESY